MTTNNNNLISLRIKEPYITMLNVIQKATGKNKSESIIRSVNKLYAHKMGGIDDE